MRLIEDRTIGSDERIYSRYYQPGRERKSHRGVVIPVITAVMAAAAAGSIFAVRSSLAAQLTDAQTWEVQSTYPSDQQVQEVQGITTQSGAENGIVQSGAEDGIVQSGVEDGIVQSGAEDGIVQSDADGSISQPSAEEQDCVAVDVTEVPHIFFHSLINDDRAFETDVLGESRVTQNNAAMTTASEFDAMIQDLYDAGYMLVGLDDLCVKTTGDDGEVHIAENKNLMLPEGKKPLVLSVDDLSYYHSYGIGTQGYATKMVVDENGKPKCEYTDPDGNTSTGDYDVVPKIDSFIEEHPDFSYNGARGTVALTGYNGVFGYRTNDYYKDINDPHLDPDQIQWLEDHPDYSFEEDCDNAKKVAEAMKAEGWTFASHTYGHLNATDSPLEKLQHDNERWMQTVEPIIGPTDKIIFAFGADIGTVGGYTSDNAKFEYYKGQGFNIFCNVDGHIGWTEFGDTYMRTGRVALDGFTMYQAMAPDASTHQTYANDYEKLGIHDIDSFFDQMRPTPIENE